MELAKANNASDLSGLKSMIQSWPSYHPTNGIKAFEADFDRLSYD